MSGWLGIVAGCVRVTVPATPSEVTDSPSPMPQSSPVVLTGAVVVGLGQADVRFEGGRITGLGDVSLDGATVVALPGQFLVPGVIDSHVHLAYMPKATELADGGVVAVVDLASPISWLAARPVVPRVLASGPMVTAVNGYPVTSWGSGGYGTECEDAAAADAAVDAHVAAGAGVIKLPVTSAPVLADDALASAASRAHALGLLVVSHALSDANAASAAAAGADWLAHTPTEALSASTLSAWSGKGVISTLRAFGGGADTIANLRALREAGATVVYGTDFGNTSTLGVDADELTLMASAGMTPAEILAAATSVPATTWGFADLGELAVDHAATLLVLETDPLIDPTALARPSAVWIDGVQR